MPTRQQVKLAKELRVKARLNLLADPQSHLRRDSQWRSKRNGRVVAVNDFMILGNGIDVQVRWEDKELGKGWLKWLTLRGFLRDYEPLEGS